MTTAAIRKQLMNYIADADEKKIKGMYLLFEEEIKSYKQPKLSGRQLKILDEERKSHLAGETRSFSWAEAKQIIRGKKKI
jgi:hypothetical protein